MATKYNLFLLFFIKITLSRSLDVVLGGVHSISNFLHKSLKTLKASGV
jgi:hypothetical protein